MIYFTSDTHFGHENIITYCDRPFQDVDEMDAALIRNWNNAITSEDSVYHLGDFTFGDETRARNYFRQLNGRIFVLGNPWHHDSRWLPSVNQVHTSGKLPKTGLAPFYSATHHQIVILPPVHILEFEEYGKPPHSQAIVLCHYPFLVWDRRHYGAWHLYGHIHDKQPSEGFSFNVGVDCNQFMPVSLDGVVRQMKAFGWVRP